jgi:hypothetical protein
VGVQDLFLLSFRNVLDIEERDIVLAFANVVENEVNGNVEQVLDELNHSLGRNSFVQLWIYQLPHICHLGFN